MDELADTVDFVLAGTYEQHQRCCHRNNMQAPYVSDVQRLRGWRTPVVMLTGNYYNRADIDMVFDFLYAMDAIIIPETPAS